MGESELPEAKEEHIWEEGFEDHRRQQQARLARLSPADKLEWLEQAHALVRQMKQARNAAAKGSEKPAP